MKVALEQNILKRHQRHSRQALDTPFFTDPMRCQAIDPLYQDSQIDDICYGSFSNAISNHPLLSPAQHEWISQLKSLIEEKISLQLTI
jgi:hypothetical protein